MKEEIQGKLDIQFDAKKEAPTQEPVMCLGMEFENDEARRAYFREELRKKLPELKKIEGYPIGEDDDIINLSDPPYYTACPNPWLNDFVAEWEKEKQQLEAEGKRKADFEVKEPYASDVSEGKNNPIYNAHSYHTKVPHPAIMRYIMHYTQPGDIVLDGFAGTGMTGVAAQMCINPEVELKSKIESEITAASNRKPNWGARHAVLGDLSPVASFIAYNYNTPANPQIFDREAKMLFEQVEKECGWMYETRHSDGTIGKINYVVWSDVFICPDCGGEIVFYDAAVDKSMGEVKDTFTCPNCGAIHTKKDVTKCIQTVFDNALNKTIQQTKAVPVLISYVDAKGKKHEKEPDDFDFELIKRIEGYDIPYWFPTDELPKGDKTQDPINHMFTHVHYFYTKRNLWVLSAFVDKLRNTSHVQIIVNSIVYSLVSKLVRYNLGHRGNGIFPGAIFVPSLIAETNVFKSFKGKAEDFSKAFNILKNEGAVTCLSSASSILIPNNSIDYIFTDPPFGSNIMYSELNFIQESWLKVKTNNKEEAIENRTQRKGLLDYQTIMQKCFSEYYRVLKPGKWITIEFSNTAASVWNSIQLALNHVGFVIANVSSLDKKQGSFNAVTSPTAVKQDLVISCYKPSDELSGQFNYRTDRKEVAWDFIQEHLEHLAVHVEKGNKTTTVIERSPKILYDRLISYYLQRGLPVPMDAQEFQLGLRERFMERDGMFFTVSQTLEYEEKRKYTDGFAPMGIIVSDEANGIEWLNNMLGESPKTYQEIQPEWMQAINGLRRGDILPELRTILEENFIEMADGRWRKPDLQDAVDKEMVHTKSLLREFNVIKEKASKPKAKLKEVRVEALRAGFKQCYKDKDFATIVMVGDKIPENLLTEDEVLLQYYDIASSRV